MSHIVLFGASDLASITNAVMPLVGLVNVCWTAVLDARSSESFSYSDSMESMTQLISRLDSGELESLQMRQDVPASVLVGIYRPEFCDEPPNQWRCVVEGQPDNMLRIYDACKDMHGLAFRSLSVDEAPEFIENSISITSFPWDDWHIIRAAVRDPSGTWIERIGPAGRLTR